MRLKGRKVSTGSDYIMTKTLNVDGGNWMS